MSDKAYQKDQEQIVNAKKAQAEAQAKLDAEMKQLEEAQRKMREEVLETQRKLSEERWQAEAARESHEYCLE